MGVELFHADGQTGRHDEASSRFSQFLRTRLKKTQTYEQFGHTAIKVALPAKFRASLAKESDDVVQLKFVVSVVTVIIVVVVTRTRECEVCMKVPGKCAQQQE